MDNPRLLLVDRNGALCDAWQSAFDGLAPQVRIMRGDFRNIHDYDCIVSPGNSFGLMDGGIDEAIIQHFGPRLMAEVQNEIAVLFRGEQPVGTSIIVDIPDQSQPSQPHCLAHTPTMRAPMSISTTDNVYNAMRAMLLAVRDHNSCDGVYREPIKTILCPGLGTGCGHMAPAEAARQMALAYRSIIDPIPDAITWAFADARQAEIGRGGDL